MKLKMRNDQLKNSLKYERKKNALLTKEVEEIRARSELEINSLKDEIEKVSVIVMFF